MIVVLFAFLFIIITLTELSLLIDALILELILGLSVKLFFVKLFFVNQEEADLISISYYY